MVRVESQSFLKSIYSGAVYGAIAWTVYAVVECWFSSIQIWVVKSNSDSMPLYWGFTALLFGLYPVIGLMVGGLSGLGLHIAAGRFQFLQKMQSATRFRAVATLTIVLTFTANLFVQKPVGISVLVLLFISFSLILGLVLSAGSGIWSRRLSFLVNPWTTSFVLLGVSWITFDLLRNHYRIIKAGSFLVYLAVVLLISFFIQRIVETLWITRSTTVESIPPVKSLTFLIPIVLVVFGISFFLNQETHAVIRSSRTLAPKVGQPNVILITMDTVRADHLSLYGYERDTTPNLEKFAEEATLYTHAIASSDMTLSTHASIFTGLYARQHGARKVLPLQPSGRPLRSKFQTLAKMLSEKGCSTMGVVANYGYLSLHFGLDQGFEYYHILKPIPFITQTEEYYLREGISNILRWSNFYSDPGYRPLKAKVINREIFALLKKAKEEDKRFFLFINYMDAHTPYLPPHPFDTLYPGKDEAFSWDDYPTFKKGVMALKRKITQKEHRHLVSQYDGGIASLDFHLGKLIARLKELGLYENSLIIITSDHGEVFGERDLIEHGVSVYQDQVHIPLVIKYPNIRQKAVADEVVSSVDLFSTIVDILGYDIPKDVQGHSLLKGEPGKSKIVISESFPYGHMLNWHPRFNRVERAIFSWPYKFISSTAGKRELYDLSKDPDEEENLYKKDDGVSKELELKLDQWLKVVKEETGSPAKLDKGALDRLKALGYVQ